MGGIPTTYPLAANWPGQVVIAGSFRPIGVSAPSDLKGSGFTVARDDVGTYTITFDEDVKFPTKVSVFLSVRYAAATIAAVQGGDYSAAARTLGLVTFVSGSAADFADDVDSEVSFMVVADNDQVSNAGD